MNSDRLDRLANASACRIVGCENANHDAQRAVLAALISGFDRPDAAILCEPSLARKTTRPPDAVLIDIEAGVHVVEVKGVSIDQIEAIEAGGQFHIRYSNGVSKKNPFAQVRNAMFDIKDATERALSGELMLPFKYWIILPRISREEWLLKWGANAFSPPELLFFDDIEPAVLAKRLNAIGKRSLSNQGIERWPADQLQAVWTAFGDSSVLYPLPDDRRSRRVTEGTLGEQFDEAAESYKTLSDEQQKLSAQNWEEGPRLVRGVAGSGKTIVLANNLARRLQKLLTAGPTLFDEPRKPRIAAVCFNRCLAPFLRKKVAIAYQQRTGSTLPDGTVDVFAYNRLMWHLKEKGLWRYQPLDDADDANRAAEYLKQLEYVKQHDPAAFDAASYDAIYIDEGQDFVEEDFRLLKELCRTPEGKEPNVYVFYDDAQNLYGRRRPNWQSVGLNVRGGRSHIMTECFRNTKHIVESAFNVLYGSFAAETVTTPTWEFSDISTMTDKGLIDADGGVWRINFAKRIGRMPVVSIAASRSQETAQVIARLRWLIEEQHVRPEDILVLSFTQRRIEELAEAIRNAPIPAVSELHVAFKERDQPLGQRGRLSLSTAASAKGYDAYCVLLASANEFTDDVWGRASFYVGCTRAIEYLEVFGYQRKGLLAEMEMSLSKLS